MNDLPTTPSTRRRRRIGVAIVVVLLGGLAWCLWPRVDQRFAGKWRSGEMVSELESSGYANEFHAFAERGGGLGVHERCRWRVRNGRFEIVAYDKTLKNWIINSYYRWQRGRKDERVFEGMVYFGAEVVEVTDNSFVLRNGPRRYRFERVTN